MGVAPIIMSEGGAYVPLGEISEGRYLAVAADRGFYSGPRERTLNSAVPAAFLWPIK